MTTEEAKAKAPLKVGLLLNSLNIPAWVEHMAEHIDRSGSAEVTLLVLREEEAPPPGDALTLASRIRGKLLRIYESIDSTPADGAFAPRTLNDRYQDVPTITTKVKTTRWIDRLPKADIEAIKEQELDVLIRIGFRILRGGILKAAKYGVWSYHHGDNRTNRGGPAGFWEVFDREPTTGSMLQILTDQLDDGVVLDSTLSATHSTSVAYNKEQMYWKTLSLIPRQLDRLHRDGHEAFSDFVEQRSNQLSFYDRDLYTQQTLSLPKTITYLIGNVIQRVRNAVHYVLYHEQWQLRYTFKEEASSAFWRFKTLLPPRDRYWADPQPLHYQGKWHIFFEDYRYDKNQAHVSVISFDEAGKPQPSQDALIRPYHLSYPFVFEWNDRLWMIPETAKSRAVEIYECVGFPDQWELRKRVLEDHYIVDATVHEHEGVWYLFANVVENSGGSSWDELFLYVNEGDFLEGDWVKHPESPVRSDVTCSRPAGPLFTHRGKLYRPSQDSRGRYGGAMAIHEVLTLTPTKYKEQVVDRIQPDWDPDLQGTHTFAHQPGLTVIDAVKDIARSGLLQKFPRWVHRLLSVRHRR